MQLNTLLKAMLSSAAILSANAFANTPNINPGFWQHQTSMSLSGPMNMPVQVTTDQECITQTDIDKGIDIIDLPSGCTLTQADIGRDSMNYAMQCDIEGLRADFTGDMQFKGNQMQGTMQSDVETPMGNMTMQMETEATRLGDC